MSRPIVLTNARLQGRPQTKVAIAYKSGVIQDVASSSRLPKMYSRAKRVDLKGAIVLPGLTDTHCHLIDVGRRLRELDLYGVNSIRVLQRQLQEKIEETESGAWVLGGGWDQERFAEARYPTRWDIDNLSKSNPVFLFRVCGHIGLANTVALSLAKISKATKNPAGGIVDRDGKGDPTGILRENAQDLVLKEIPPPSLQEVREAVRCASGIALQKGLTKIHCILSHNYRIESRAFRELHKEKALKLRIRLYLPPEALDHLSELWIPPGSKKGSLEIGGIKVFSDGSLGARTAALSRPYADEPSSRGVLIYPPRELARILGRATQAGLQVAIHAIGDRAVRACLRAIAAQGRLIRRLRPRIEHASVLSPGLLRTIQRLRVCIAAQPRFAISDAWVGKRVGRERLRWVYAFKSLVDAGVVVAGGSDAPVEPLSPFEGMWAAMTSTKEGMEERLSLEEAVKLYTENAAYVGFEEDVRGKIAKNYQADFTIVKANLVGIRKAELRRVEPILTIVDGRIAYADRRALKERGIVLPRTLIG